MTALDTFGDTTIAEPTPEHRALAERDASLGVRHIWTNQHCVAYYTYDPEQCSCRFYNTDGTLTRYSFACGYVEMYGDWLAGDGVRLYRDGCFHVVGKLAGDDDGTWECFDDIPEARQFARSLRPFRPAPDAFSGK